MLLPFCYIRLIPRRVLIYLLEARDDLLAGMGNFGICRHDRLDVYRDRIPDLHRFLRAGRGKGRGGHRPVVRPIFDPVGGERILPGAI